MNEQSVIEGLKEAREAKTIAVSAKEGVVEIKQILKEGFKEQKQEAFLLRNSINKDISIRYDSTIKKLEDHKLNIENDEELKSKALVAEIALLINTKLKPIEDKIIRTETAGYVFAVTIISIGGFFAYVLDAFEKIQHLFS